MQEAQSSDLDFWFSLVVEYPDDLYHEAIMYIVKRTTEAYPRTNMIAVVIEKMDSISSGRKLIEDAQAETDRKAKVRKDSDDRAAIYIAEANEEEARMTPKHFQGEIEAGKTPEEIMQGLAANVGQDLKRSYRTPSGKQKSIKEMTQDSVDHCNSLIDETKSPINMADFKKPWDQERIELVRKKLKAKTEAAKAKGVEEQSP